MWYIGWCVCERFDRCDGVMDEDEYTVNNLGSLNVLTCAQNVLDVFVSDVCWMRVVQDV